MAHKVRVLRTKELEEHPLRDAVTIKETDDTISVVVMVKVTANFPKSGMSDISKQGADIPLSIGEAIAERMSEREAANDYGSIVASKVGGAVLNAISS